MVGFDSNKSISFSNSFLAGFCGGVLTRAIISPLDVVKIRFQLQPEKNRSQLKYNGIFQAVAIMYKEEGARVFWKGHTPAQCLSMINGGLQFSSFHYFTSVANNIYPHSRDDHAVLALTHFSCGCLSGGIANCFSQPVDVLRTRLAAQKEPMVCRNIVQLASRMFHHEGVSSFYRGLTPSLIQVIPYCGFQFASYTTLKKLTPYILPSENMLSHLSCGATAGIVSKVLVYPLDVTKKRLQVQGFQDATVSAVVRYQSFRHCVITIAKTEGVAGLYKGLTVAVLKSGTMTGLIFCTYEMFSELLSNTRGVVF